MTKVKEKYGVGGSPTKNVTDSSLAQPSPWNSGQKKTEFTFVAQPNSDLHE